MGVGVRSEGVGEGGGAERSVWGTVWVGEERERE